MSRNPSGTCVSRLPRCARAVERLPIDTHVPSPGPRYGISERLKATLLDLRAGTDDSFLTEDRSLVYRVAKEIGVNITSRPEGEKHRVWRLP